MNKITLSFSALDRLAACPASYYEAMGKPSLSSEHSVRGQIVDECYREEEPDVEAICAAFNAPELADDVRRILQGAPWPFDKKKTQWQVPLTLVLRNCTVVGTVDALITETYGVWDVKVTELRGNAPPVDQRLQIKGYAAAAIQQFHWPHATAVVFYPLADAEHRTSWMIVDEVRSTCEAIAHIADEIINTREDRRRYSPGDACTFCPASDGSCKALSKGLSLGIIDTAGLPANREQYPALWKIRGVVKNKIEAWEKLVKLDLEHNGRAVNSQDGSSLELRQRWKKQSISAAFALDWLTEHGHAELADQIQAAHEARPKYQEDFVHWSKGKNDDE